MPDREKVFDAFRNCITEPKCKDCPWETCEEFHQTKKIPLDLCLDILKLLKEHDNEKKRIMKVIWDVLHEGLSIDTVADQDWVYEQIRHKIEDT